MTIEVDTVADAALISWGTPGPISEDVRRGGGKGVRVLFDDAGDVVGVEVLGWSHRTNHPFAVGLQVVGENGATAVPSLCASEYQHDS